MAAGGGGYCFRLLMSLFLDGNFIGLFLSYFLLLACALYTKADCRQYPKGGGFLLRNKFMTVKQLAEGGGIKLGANHPIFPLPISLGRLAGKAITYHRFAVMGV